jgi:hypothetical protein
MAQKPKQPWHQKRGEPKGSYARFLIYRNLGPCRTVTAAYQVVKKGAERCPGQWQRDSTKWSWCERAAAWDIAVLLDVGKDVIVGFVNSLRALSRKTLAALNDEAIKPGGWANVLEAINVLGHFISPEAVERLCAQAADDRQPAAKRPGLAS